MKRSRERAKTALESEHIGMTMKDYGVGKAWIIDASTKQITPEIIQHLTALERVTELNLSKSSITDSQLQQLANNKTDTFSYLMKMDLSNTPISDKGLSAINQFARLKELDVSGSRVTQEGVERVLKARSTLSEIPADHRNVKIIR